MARIRGTAVEEDEEKAGVKLWRNEHSKVECQQGEEKDEVAGKPTLVSASTRW